VSDSEKHSYQTPLLIALLPLLILFVCATILFWLSKQGMAESTKYWEVFVPVVAVISLISGWGQAYLANRSRLMYLVRQVLHWGAFIGVLYLFNTQGIRELMSDQQYAIVVIYLLAFASLLAAIHVDFKLIFFGIFLVFCAFLLAVPTDNPTLISMGQTFGIADAQNKPMMMTIGVAVVGFIASWFLLSMMRGALVSKRIAERRGKKD
jgi:hypothetical protein